MDLTSRERFIATFAGTSLCSPPLWGDGIREDVVADWASQGVCPDADWERALGIERFEVVQPDLRHADFSFTPVTDPEPAQTCPVDDLGRYPRDWDQQVVSFATRDFAVGLRVSRGLFLTFGVADWNSLAPLLIALHDEPETMSHRLREAAEFATRVLQRAYDSVKFDFVVFSEPIASNFAPVISPEMLRRVCGAAYEALLSQARKAGVSHVVFQTYGSTAPLIPAFKDLGGSILWSGESGVAGVSYPYIRNRYGGMLGLIGGIDSAILSLDENEMERCLELDVVPLLAQGRYLPLLDGRVRRGISFESYARYRHLLKDVVARACGP